MLDNQESKELDDQKGEDLSDKFKSLIREIGSKSYHTRFHGEIVLIGELYKEYKKQQRIIKQLTATQQALDSAVDNLKKLLPLAKKAITGSRLDDARGGFKEFVESPRQIIADIEAALASIKE